MDKQKCNGCGEEVPVKKDGNLWKHQGLDGSDCNQSPKKDHVTSAEPVSFSVDVTKQDQEVSIDSADAVLKKRLDDEERGVTEEAPAAPAPVTGSTFSFSMTVSENCIFLDDPRWQGENKLLAKKKATDSGLKVVGEPQQVKSEVVGRNRILYYEVPVE